VVYALPYSDFIRFYKCASMIEAKNSLADIQNASFHTYNKQDREKVIRGLKKAMSAFMHRELKGFAEVVANFTKKVNRG
jgi:hypothetical protein